MSDLYDPREQWASYLLNAIKAKELFIKDVSYIVRSNEVRPSLGIYVLAGRRAKQSVEPARPEAAAASRALSPTLHFPLIPTWKTPRRQIHSHHVAMSLPSDHHRG